jgi:anti-sigma28 factor (negative regulator of flagellin synthesis)
MGIKTLGQLAELTQDELKEATVKCDKEYGKINNPNSFVREVRQVLANHGMFVDDDGKARPVEDREGWQDISTTDGSVEDFSVRTANQLEAIGIKTLGELAKWSRRDLRRACVIATRTGVKGRDYKSQQMSEKSIDEIDFALARHGQTLSPAESSREITDIRYLIREKAIELVKESIEKGDYSFKADHIAELTTFDKWVFRKELELFLESGLSPSIKVWVHGQR